MLSSTPVRTKLSDATPESPAVLVYKGTPKGSSKWVTFEEASELCSTMMVPTLTAAFALNVHSTINLDPIVLAVNLFLNESVTAGEMLTKGSAWFPDRSVHSLRSETERMKRFAASYPQVFDFYPDADDPCLRLKHGALTRDYLENETDEHWYRIALMRLWKHDSQAVNAVIADLEVGTTDAMLPPLCFAHIACPRNQAVQRAFLNQELSNQVLDDTKERGTDTDELNVLERLDLNDE